MWPNPKDTAYLVTFTEEIPYEIKDLIFVQMRMLTFLLLNILEKPNLVSSSLRNSEITSFLDVWFPVTCVNVSANFQQLVQSYIRENLCLETGPLLVLMQLSFSYTNLNHTNVKMDKWVSNDSDIIDLHFLTILTMHINNANLPNML